MNIHQPIALKNVKSEVIMMHNLCYQLLKGFISKVLLSVGCGRLYVTDGIWKTVFPHCMFRVEVSSLY